MHVSAAVAAVLQAPRDPAVEPTMPHLEVLHRGKIPVKGKGDVDTYWLIHPTLGVANLVPAMSEVAGLLTGASALTSSMLTELPPAASKTSDVSTTSHHTAVGLVVRRGRPVLCSVTPARPATHCRSTIPCLGALAGCQAARIRMPPLPLLPWPLGCSHPLRRCTTPCGAESPN